VIRDETEYGGIRVRLFGDLADARVPIQADIGFGEAMTPEAQEIEFPTLLGNPAPHLRTYPRETPAGFVFSVWPESPPQAEIK
jgi:hypothetical protein